MSSFRIIIPVFNPPMSFVDNLIEMRNAEPGLTENVIVVDDASTNDVIEMLGDRAPEAGVIAGDGALWWAGGMRKGMQAALDEGVDVLVWLNHDCLPDPGTIRGLVAEAATPGVGAVSAWCRTCGYEDWPVNPGFINFRPIPREALEAGDSVEVDGVNGNCVAINADAVRAVGLPDARAHPHYGDGPYTWRLHRAGFRNRVAPRFRATLSRDLERCIDERDHSMIWNAPLTQKLRYYFTSPRSKFHWKNRFHDMRVFRGPLAGLIAYPAAQLHLALKVAGGHLAGKRVGMGPSIDRIVETYRDDFPPEGLRAALERLAQKNP